MSSGRKNCIHVYILYRFNPMESNHCRPLKALKSSSRESITQFCVLSNTVAVFLIVVHQCVMMIQFTTG